MADEEEDEVIDIDEEEPPVPLPLFSHFSFLANLARLRAEEDEIENQMMEAATRDSMDTYHQSLFRKNSQLELSISPVMIDHEDQCLICLEKIDAGSEVIRLECKHIFHSSCIRDVVIHQHASCPICRHTIPIHEKKS